MTVEEIRKKIADLKATGFHREAHEWANTAELCERLDSIIERLDRALNRLSNIKPAPRGGKR